MVVDEVMALIREVDAAALDVDDLDHATAALDSCRRLQGWLESCQARLTSMIARCTPAPEAHVGRAGRVSERHAEALVERAATAGQLVPFGDALSSGSITGAHLDAVARARRSLAPDERMRFDDRAEDLAWRAGQCDADRFARLVAAEARRARVDGGESELARQKRAVRCRSWVDPATGMWHLRVELDPETGVWVDARIRAATEAMFAEAVPSTCPSDPLEKQAHLRALAVTELLRERGARPAAGRPEVIVVVDTRCAAHAAHQSAGPHPDLQPVIGREPVRVPTRPSRWDLQESDVDPGGVRGNDHDRCSRRRGDHEPVVDWGLPVAMPPSVLTDLYRRADVRPVLLCRGAVIHAEGRLELGRATRLANAAQRRALRALYATCAVPGCAARFDHCKIHHVVWWRNGGRTDIANLLPLCPKHHSSVHDHGWHLTLHPDRTLTVELPDGTRMTNGPPNRRAP